MIYQRAILSLKNSQSQVQKSLYIKPFSRISSSFFQYANPKPTPVFSSFSYSTISNQKRFDLRFFSPFYGKNAVCGHRNMSTRRMKDSGSNMPPKETILLDGCDFEHWLVVLEAPDPNLTRDEIIDTYIKTLAQCVGSEEEARKSIYSVSTKHYFAFSCIVSEELSYKIKELPKVRWVLPDSYLDVPNKRYGGEPFINGQAVPYDPRYHEIWVRNYTNSKNNNNKNRDRKRNDRNGFSGRRRDNMINNEMVPSSTSTSPAPNPSSHASTRTPSQNFTPASTYTNSVVTPRGPTQDFSNSGIPSPGRSMDSSQVQSPDFQRSNILPPQVQYGYFPNKNTHMQNESHYAPSPPAQIREFQSRNDPSMRNMESHGRNTPPFSPTQQQNWSSSSYGFQPSPQNQNFQSNNFPSFQNKHLEKKDMPPVQNLRSSDGSNMPPVPNPGFQNGNNMPSPGFQNVPSNFNMHNSAPNHEIHDNGLPSRVDNHYSQLRQSENFQPGYQQNHNVNLGILHNQNREAPGFTNHVNMQNRDYNVHDMPGFVNSYNTLRKGYQGQNMPRDANIPTQNAQNSGQQDWGSSYGDYEMMHSPKRDQPSQNMQHRDYEALANRNI